MTEKHIPDPTQHKPKDIRLLADILALILDDEKGQADAALERLRQRAKHAHITGGALKNLFHALVEANHITDKAPEELQQQKKQKRLKEALEQLAEEHRKLQAYFAALQEENTLLRQNSAQYRVLQPLHRAALVTAIITGILLGIAATEFIHNLQMPIPK